MTGATLLALGVIVAAGVALSVQAPLNAALGRSIGASVPAAAVSFAVGAAALTLVALMIGQGGGFLRLGQAPAWQLVGGFFGAFYVWSALWGVGSVGVLTMVAALILGQLLGGLAVDAMGAFGVPLREISLTRVAAVLMVGGGLILSRL